MMRIACGISVTAAALLLLGCKDSGTASSSASFSADARTPGPKQVFLTSDAASGSSIAASVRVRVTTGIHSADLTLSYDPVRLLFRSSSAGTLLEQGNATVTYDVRETTPGVLRIQVQRTTSGTVNAGTDDPPLVSLAFDVLIQGSAPAAFSSSALFDESGNPIPGVVFFGGAFIGS
jgi:hypothetical protein